MTETNSILDVIAFLNSWHAAYRGGVPIAGRISAPLSMGPCFGQYSGSLEAEFIFVRRSTSGEAVSEQVYTGEEGSFLRDVVVKGLRRDLAEVGLLRLSAFELQQDWPRELSCKLTWSGKVVVILGVDLLAASAATVKRGDAFELAGNYFVVTHELSAAKSDPQCKREFWADLQLAMGKRNWL